MGTINHIELANGRWQAMPLSLQMANIGSEVSRALRWQDKNPARMKASLDRALELIDLSIKVSQPGNLKELCRAREELCDYFVGDNTFNTNPAKLMRYYDQFAVRN